MRKAYQTGARLLPSSPLELAATRRPRGSKSTVPLAAISLANANASVQSDVTRITAAVEREVGVDAFNALVRKGLAAEYASVAQRATFR